MCKVMTMRCVFVYKLIACLSTIMAHPQHNGYRAGRPNILLIMADQMRADLLGSSGNKIAITPNLDKLASQGAMYCNAFSSTPTCTPARAAILTGLSPWYHGMLGYGHIAKRYHYEMPRALSDAGYYTVSIGKDHFGWNNVSNSGTSHGYNDTYLYDGLSEEVDDYDQWIKAFYPGIDPMATGLDYNDYRGAPYALPEYLHPTAWVGRSATAFLKKYNKSMPFFLKVSFHRPHSPYDPPKRWLDRFDPLEMPEPHIGNWDWKYAVRFGNMPDPDIWEGDLGREQVRRSRQAYYASAGFVDEWIGNILDMLETLKIRNNTFIIFTADHGDMMGDHYLWRKGYPYFGSASIPMIISWPPYMDYSRGGAITAPRGSVMDHVTELRDIFPTVLDAAGIPTKEMLNGSSMLRTLQGRTDLSWRMLIDLEHDVIYDETIHWNALTDGHWKYIFQACDGSELLFNLDKDPHELEDVSESEKQTLKKWRQYMVKQFVVEGRGEDWVKDGELMKRREGLLYSPNYPDSIREQGHV